MDGRTVWNLAFVVAAGTVLVLSASEVPGMPRLWIVGYAMQCVLHMVFVCVEYRRQRRQQPAVASSVQDRIGSSSGNLSVSSREGSASASASAQYVSLGQLDDESTRLSDDVVFVCEVSWENVYVLKDNWSWDLKWRRNLFDHENDLAVDFMEEITYIPIQSHLKDTMLWKAEPSGVYSTKSAYRLMMNSNRSGLDGRTFKIIWKLKIPPRAAVFSWRLFKDKLPTRANLLRRNVSIQEVECPLCGYEHKEAGHLFFNCKMIIGLWWESMRWIQAVGPLSASPASHFVQYCDGFGAARNHSRWCGWWIALTSTIWQHRNLLIFKGKPFDSSKVMDDALFLAWSWLKAREKDFNNSFNHWSTNILDSFAHKYDLNSTAPFQTSDILDLHPIVKHSIPVSAEAKGLVETGKLQFAEVTGPMHREVANCCRYVSCFCFDIRGEGSDCTIWYGDLLDIRLIPEAGQDRYIRLAVSETEIIIRVKGKNNESQQEDFELPLFDFA
ncbi:Clustered mitochondria protein [Glycine soja]